MDTMNAKITCGRCLSEAVRPAAGAVWLASLSALISAMWVVVPGATHNRLFSVACMMVLAGVMAAAIAVQVLVKREMRRLGEQGFLFRQRLHMARWMAWAAGTLVMVAMLMSALRSRHDFADTVLTIAVSVFLALALRNLWLVIRWIRRAQTVAPVLTKTART